jgi:S1-C subfamily serine protease
MTTTDVKGRGFASALSAGRNRRIAIGIVIVLGCIATYVLVRPSSKSKAAAGPTIEQQVTTAVDKAMKKAAAAPSTASLVYQTISPSLVVITTEDAPSVDAGPSDTTSPADPLVPNGPTETIPGQKNGLGTGVIINEQGAILTANHVVSAATSIRVIFADGTRGNARIVSQDPTKDIAVLAADATPEVLVPAVMGGGVNVGDEVFAVGHPLGLINSLSAGVVSGLGRSIPVDDSTKLEDLIQFDAAVNPGNSGGPLLNRGGQVVGIVTALANPSEQNFFVGIGFAVPIATAGGAAGGPSQ